MQKKSHVGVSIVLVTLQKEEVGLICFHLKQIMCKSLCLSKGKPGRALQRFPGTEIGRFIVVLAVASLAACGCSKKQSEARNAQATSSADTNAFPASAASNPVVVQPAAPGAVVASTVDLPDIQRSVIRWVVTNRRRPSNFEEFAATADVKIPAPPAGKKYYLPRDLHVQLVNR
jgi:hypothetical protein